MKQRNNSPLNLLLESVNFDNPLDFALIPSQSNFSANTAFLCDSPEDFWVLSPLVAALPDSEFVFYTEELIQYSRKGVTAFVVLSQLMKLASQHGLPWRLYPPLAKSYLRQRLLLFEEAACIADFFRRYDLLVGTQMAGLLAHPAVSHIKKVLFRENPMGWMDLKNVATIDAAAVPGNVLAQLYHSFVPTGVVGSPRLEKAARNSASESVGNIMLYAPSRLNLRLRESIFAIADHVPDGYRLRILLPYTRTQGKHLWGPQDKTGIEFYFSGEIDKSRLTQTSTVVILEDLDCFLDGLFFEKPMILFDALFTQTGFDPDEHPLPQEDTRHFGFTDPTVADIGLVLKRPENLPKALKLLNRQDIRQEIRNRTRRIKPLLISQEQTAAVKRSVLFLQSVKRKPRSGESFLGRAVAAQLSWEQLIQYYKQTLNIKPPFGPIALRILRTLMSLGQ